MADCQTDPNYSGRNVLVEFSIACGDIDPKTLSYLPVGSTNSKTVSVGTTTTSNTSDDTTGVESNIVTFLTFEVTANGFATQSDSIKSNQALLKKYLVEEVVASRQPVVWVRVILPDVTYYAYCNVTTTNVSGTSTDTATFEATFSSTGTGTTIAAVQIEDTP